MQEPIKSGWPCTRRLSGPRRFPDAGARQGRWARWWWWRRRRWRWSQLVTLVAAILPTIGYPVESLITPRLIAIGLIAALFADLELIFLFGVLE